MGRDTLRESCGACLGYKVAYGGGDCKYCNGKGYLTPEDEGYESMKRYNNRKYPPGWIGMT